MDLLYHTWRALPGSYELELLEHGVGFRPALRDNLPAIGPVSTSGLILATGHFRHGIMLAPATAKRVLDSITNRDSFEMDQPFSPGRFSVLSTQELS